MFTHTYDSIISIDNILAAWEELLRGKKHKLDIAVFQSCLADNVATLHASLKNKTYAHGPYTAFNISDPKPRNIHKATVRDRLVHHVLYRALYHYFDTRFIYDSYSCREKKGTHKALDRFRLLAGKVSRNYTRTCYVLKCDIKKFFANIDHAVLMSILERDITDENIRWLINQVAKSFHSFRPGIGLPLGNLTSQLFVNVYMHEFDRFMKQELREKHYIRYADDFVVLSDRRDHLEQLLLKIDGFLKSTLGLSLHEHKVSIKAYASGVDFLGWVHFPHHRSIRASTKRRIMKNLKRYPKPETVNAYRGLLGHGNAYRLRKRLGLAE